MPVWLSLTNPTVLLVAGAMLLLFPSPAKTVSALLVKALAQLGITGGIATDLAANAEQAAYVAAFLTLMPKLTPEQQAAVWTSIMPPKTPPAAK